MAKRIIGIIEFVRDYYEQPEEKIKEKYTLNDLRLTKTKEPKYHKYFNYTQYNDFNNFITAINDELKNIYGENSRYILSEDKKKQRAELINRSIARKETLKAVEESKTMTMEIPKAEELVPVIESNKISVNEIFQLSDFAENMAKNSGSTFLFVGSSKSGKTTLMHALAKMWKQLYPKTILIIISSTWKSSGIWQDLKDDDIIITDKLTESINLVQKMQKKDDSKRVLFILDDIILEKHNKKILELFLTLRNYNISTMMSIQSLKIFNKYNRGSVNYAFLLNLNSNEEIEDTYKILLRGSFSDDKNYIKDYKEKTKNYGKMFLDKLNNKLYDLS